MVGIFRADSVFSQAVLNAFVAQADGLYIISIEDNPYLEEIYIPQYSDNGSQIVITTAMSKTTIEGYLNNPAYKNTYIVPGDYRNHGEIDITLSGVSSQERQTLSLYDPTNPTDDTHPASLVEANNAQIALRFNGADYWTLDRLSNFGSFARTIRFVNSEHIVVNRFYSNLNAYSMQVDNGSHYFTLQKSRFDGAVSGDAVGINLAPWAEDYYDNDGHRHSKILHAKFIQNEFVDQNDGWQATVWEITSGSLFQYCNVGGLIVNDNDFYLNTGFSDKENATDTKCGSPDPRPDTAHDNNTDNPTIACIISGNRMWGYNGGSDNSGNAAMIASMHSNGYQLYDNIIFGCNVASSGGGNEPITGIPFGYVDSTITNNIYYQCGDENNGSLAHTSPTVYNNSRNTQIEGNYFIEPLAHDIGYHADNKDGSTFGNNKIIDPYLGTWSVENRTDFPNDAAFIASQATNAEVPRAGFTDYKFYKDKYTNTPTLVTLPNILDPDGTIVSPI